MSLAQAQIQDMLDLDLPCEVLLDQEITLVLPVVRSGAVSVHRLVFAPTRVEVRTEVGSEGGVRTRCAPRRGPRGGP
jgi:hypothetical protein